MLILNLDVSVSDKVLCVYLPAYITITLLKQCFIFTFGSKYLEASSRSLRGCYTFKNSMVATCQLTHQQGSMYSLAVTRHSSHFTGWLFHMAKSNDYKK